MNLEDAFEQFMSELPGQSEDNQRNYRRRLRILVSQHGKQPARELTRAQVNQWHRHMLNLGHAPATNAGYRQALKSFIKWLVEGGYLTKNISDHLAIGSFKPQVVKLPNENDVERVTTVAWRLLDKNDYVSVRRATLWLYTVESACRLSGLHSLLLAEVKRGLSVKPENGLYKFSAIEKAIPVVHSVNEDVANVLRRCLELRPPGGRHFFVRTKPTIKQMTKSAIRKEFVRIAEGVIDKTIYVHTLRHRAGDKITREISPKAAQKKLNHASLKTTLEWYHDASEQDLQNATRIVGVSKPADEAVEMARLFGVHD